MSLLNATRLAVPHPRTLNALSRSLCATRICRSNLENIFDGGPAAPVQVKSVSNKGIELADGLVVSSACIFLGGKVLLWKVPPTTWEGWSTDRFEVLEVAIPRPELLVFGTGRTTLQPPPSIRRYLSELGIGVEVMDTRNACSTYNLLAEEGRRVAAALLSPR